MRQTSSTPSSTSSARQMRRRGCGSRRVHHPDNAAGAKHEAAYCARSFLPKTKLSNEGFQVLSGLLTCNVTPTSGCRAQAPVVHQDERAGTAKETSVIGVAQYNPSSVVCVHVKLTSSEHRYYCCVPDVLLLRIL